MNTSRRTVLKSAAVLTTTWPLAGVNAKNQWPAKPIKIVVPFAPGGSNDILSRAIGTKLAAKLGQPVVIENRTGAGGVIGSDAVARAAPDGYTLMLNSTSLTTTAAFGRKLPYDPERDFQPVGLIASTPLVIAVSSTMKVNSLGEYLDLAKANPGAISYGTPGQAGVNHLTMELLAAQAKVRLLHVPYKGIAPAVSDLLGGNVPSVISSIASIIPYKGSDKLKLLAVTGAQRSPFLPDVPTVAETRLPGFAVESWWGILCPAGVPQAIVKRLNEELNEALRHPDLRELLAREGATSRSGTPDELRALVSTELVRWRTLVKNSNLTID